MKKLVKMLAVAAVVAGTFSLAQANGEITADQATAIALARVPGANASHVYKVHPDFEDGRKFTKAKFTSMVWSTNLKLMLLQVK